MAEDFVLSVNVDADVSRFRATLRAELEAAAKQQATIPIGATAGAAGTTTVPPGGAGVSPGASATASSVAQQSAQSVANAAARAGVPFTGTISGMSPAAAATQNAASAGGFNPNGWMALHPGGWAAINAAGGGAPVAAPGVDPGIQQQMMSAPLPPPGQFSERWAPINSGLRARGMFGGLYFAHAAGRLATAEMDYGRRTRLAQGDPTEIIQAELQHRRDIANAFSIPGHLGLALREGLTGEEESVERVNRATSRQNEHIQLMRQTGEISERFRDIGALAGLRGSAQSRAGADIELRSQLQEIQQGQIGAAESIHKDIDAQRADLEVEYQRRLGPAGRRNPAISKPGLEQWHDTQLQALQTAENDAVARSKDTFTAARRGAELAHKRAIDDINRGDTLENLRNFGAANVSNLRGASRPYEAGLAERTNALASAVLMSDPQNRAGIIARGLASINEYKEIANREFHFDQMQLEGRGRVLNKLIGRDPLGARIQAIQEETDQALKKAEELPAGPVRIAREREIVADWHRREALARMEDSDSRQLRIQSLDNRKEHYDLLAQNKQYTAQATDIKRQTEEDVSAMQQSKRFSIEEIKKRMELGISEETALGAELRRRMNAGMGMEVASGSFAPGGGDTGGGMESVVQGIQSMKTAIDEMKAALNALIGSP